MKNNIDLTSAQKAAWELFKARHSHTDFYGDPATGEVELRFAGMLPPDGCEWITAWDEGYIEYNQDMCETDIEVKTAFEHWWNEAGAEFIAELEAAWQATRDIELL